MNGTHISQNAQKRPICGKAWYIVARHGIDASRCQCSETEKTPHSILNTTPAASIVC